MRELYKDLYERNKEALEFIKKEEGLTDLDIESIIPISRSKLNSKTIVGIADLMTKFSKYINEKNERD